jgi:hypothetical protein
VKKFSILLAVLLTTGANAQSNFEKLSIYGKFNQMTSSTKLTENGSSLDGIGSSDTAISIGLDKGFAFADKGIVLLGAEAMLSKPTFLDLQSGSTSASIKQRNGYSFYVAPGLQITDDALVYFKVGYEKLKGEGGGNLVGDISFTGSSYGVGSRINLDSKLFINVEFKQMSFGQETSPLAGWKPKATIGSVGVGYRF